MRRIFRFSIAILRYFSHFRYTSIRDFRRLTKNCKARRKTRAAPKPDVIGDLIGICSYFTPRLLRNL